MQFGSAPVSGRFRIDLEVDRDRASTERETTKSTLQSLFGSLIAREQEVVGYVAAGLMNKQIAPEIGVSEFTVGGNCHGYIGDLARMGIAGEPDAELEDLLAEIEATQQAAFKSIRVGVNGAKSMPRPSRF